MTAKLHQRAAGAARDAFRRLRKRGRVVEGRHYFRAPRGQDPRGENCGTSGGPPGDQVLLTERGYLLVVKTFDDDLSWEVQEHLVDCYFRAREVARTLPSDAVIVSLADLQRLQAHVARADDQVRQAVALAKQAKRKASRAARELREWQILNKTVDVRRLASTTERPEQTLFAGISYATLVLGEVQR